LKPCHPPSGFDANVPGDDESQTWTAHKELLGGRAQAAPQITPWIIEHITFDNLT